MADTKIEWADAVWNPVVGCSIVSPGCHHCYAATMAKRLRRMALADLAKGRDPGVKRHYIDAVDDEGRWTGKLVPVPEKLAEPLARKKPTRYFVNSMSDLFHENVPDEFILAVFGVMAACPQHKFMVLTKRAEQMRDWTRKYFVESGGFGAFIRSEEGRNRLRHEFDAVAKLEINGGRSYRAGDDPWSLVMNAAACHMGTTPLPNVELGVSCEDQKRADERVPKLLETPAAVRFVSAEPLLGPIDFRRWLLGDRYFMTRCKSCGWVSSSAEFGLESYESDSDLVCPKCDAVSPSEIDARVDQIITGGESGPESRIFRVGWGRQILNHTRGTSTAFYLKQVGANVVDRNDAISGDEVGDWPEGTDVEFGDQHQGADCRIRLKHSKGGDPAEWPADLRVREFPSEVRS